MALFRGMQQVSETVHGFSAAAPIHFGADFSSFFFQLSAAPAYVQKLHDIRSKMDATRVQVQHPHPLENLFRCGKPVP